MKRMIVICGLLLFGAFIAGSVVPEQSLASRPTYKAELTSKSELKEANRLYKKAIRYIKDGDGVSSPLRAAGFYASGEAYLRNAIYELKERGTEHNIDVAEEVKFCEDLEKEIHSRQGMARRERTY